ncbi:MAG TPA: methylated-DNA--[protein]-cysteine S-methyltransferase [Pseudolabrys sp.]
MTTYSFALFDTAIGTCGIVWTSRGIAGVQVHNASERATRASLLHRFPDAQEVAPLPAVQWAIDGIVALLRGEPSDLSDVTIDVDKVPAFNRKVYDIARSIPPGATLTYGEIAERLGDKLLARDVGQALGQNPIPLIVPCHRVLAAGGKTGGFSAPGGVVSKLRLLTIEGAQPNGPTLFDHLPLAAKRRRRG